MQLKAGEATKMNMPFKDRIGVWLSPNKIHKLKLTNSLCVLLIALFKILFGRLACSGQTQRLEEAFKNHFNTKNAVIFPHARTALHFILKSLRLEEGDEVLMTPLTIADMVNSIHTSGLKPVFVDIELDTFSFDIEQLKKAITPRSKVILVTYIFGVVPDMEKIQQIALENNLKIIEDASQCFDASYKGQTIGTFGEAAFFSLTNFKICSSLFGGMVITNNEELANRLAVFRRENLIKPQSPVLLNLALKDIIYSIFFSKWIFSYFTYFVIYILEKISPMVTYRLYSGNVKVILGLKGNELLSDFPQDYLLGYTDIQATVGLNSLVKAGERTAARIKNGDLLRELLKGVPDIKIPVKLQGAVNVYWRFPIISEDMEGLKRFLLDYGIDSAPTYLSLCSKEKGFEAYHRSLPNAEKLKEGVLVVEVNEDLREKDIYLIASLVRRYFKREG